MNCNEQGNCICVHCNTIIAHCKGMPCKDSVCPNCGKRMLRENGYHHKLYMQKQAEKKNG